MPPPLDQESPNISISIERESNKRKLEDKQARAAAARVARQSSISSKSSRASTEGESSQSAVKRRKSSHHSGTPDQKENMSRTAGVLAQPEVIDLTSRPSNFQPHTGAKRLVIKNLRTDSRVDIGQYYEKIWGELGTALDLVFQRKDPVIPLEVLCRGVEATCRHGSAETLYKEIKDRSLYYLTKELLPAVMNEAGSTNVEALRIVYKYWTIWVDQLTLIRSIFSYLDRSYLLSAKQYDQLEDMGTKQFRDVTFGLKGKSVASELSARVILGVYELIDYDRNGERELFDHVLLKDSISMLHILGTYTTHFEGRFQMLSRKYFESFAQDRCNSTLKAYVSACENLLNQESLRCDTYNLDSSTKTNLLDSIYLTLVQQRSDALLDESGVSKLLGSNDIDSLRALYNLLKLSKIHTQLKKPWETYIKATGSNIVIDKEKGEEMVVRLLELKRSLDVIVRDAFHKDDAFTYTLREAFGNFINDRKNTSAWSSGDRKVGEMIAKHIDALLRGGLKAVPRSLLSDSMDRDEAEKRGQSSTGDEDAELDRQLDQSLELFRFIHGKDAFEAFYKKDLARRILMSRSASQDAERNMLAKLKAECGNAFTRNLEQMFKDQELARDEMVTYKQHLSNTSTTTMDLQVSILSAAAWPSYPDVTVNLPDEVARHIDKYDRHYKHKHTGRRLTWKHALAHSVVKAKFNKGTKELLVSAFQAIVLVLFNNLPQCGSLSYEHIQQTTGLVDVELQRTLQSLACGKLRILTKHPKGRDVNPTDTFTINLNFTDPKYRIKINQIQLKETKEENEQTHERVVQDRQYETQAAIVRIMKSRKTMTHANLVAEVINQTKGRGAVELPEIKKNIEKLIEKDYLEREGGSYVYLA
ncbi:hypothetical protein B7494_g3310 [Chlorociboria aeruginascens]|nr:hypothetical protein B7494_g3310 [Chlorociboria aeruginascens]